MTENSNVPAITNETVLRHVCEVCGREEAITVEEGYKSGWDYPPSMGAFTVLSPRTCPTCPMTSTLWWRLQTGETTPDSLNATDEALLFRVMNEPDSILL